MSVPVVLVHHLLPAPRGGEEAQPVTLLHGASSGRWPGQATMSKEQQGWRKTTGCQAAHLQVQIHTYAHAGH